MAPRALALLLPSLRCNGEPNRTLPGRDIGHTIMADWWPNSPLRFAEILQLEALFASTAGLPLAQLVFICPIPKLGMDVHPSSPSPVSFTSASSGCPASSTCGFSFVCNAAQSPFRRATLALLCPFSSSRAPPCNYISCIHQLLRSRQLRNFSSE